MASLVKKEPDEARAPQNDGVRKKVQFPSVIDICSSSDDSDSDSDSGGATKKRKLSNAVGVFVPPAPLMAVAPVQQGSKQFWKAGDYEGAPSGDWEPSSGGMDRVRVHPKFLHSNATSHKWALGAFAELLDNALDEVCNGATLVNIDMNVNKKDASRMLLIEDDGGGMDPDKMRHCMSLGYSAKSKIAHTIGQYGNGFKTSTMRLGADVIVFSRCEGKDGKSPTQSIGLLSYTFLRSTGKEDIVVPMLDYESRGGEWQNIVRSSLSDWNKNLETIVHWSPFTSEAELLHQFCMMKDHGTRIIIYNLWEDDQGLLELDFDTDPQDIQIRGVNRDEKNIQMAKKYPNSRHFLTYRHSLRSYASILYLRLPPCFRIILRGKDVEHHNIVNDMMQSEMVKYRPQPGPDGIAKDISMSAEVTIGFVKDAKFHIDVQGFNVYHKNRLIKPFWRLWNAAGSDGRGVIGVLEANFVEPAHDKQGFERTTALARLEARLVQMQKNYWRSKCHQIGYAPRHKAANGSDRESSPDYLFSSSAKKKSTSTSYLFSSSAKKKSTSTSYKTSAPTSSKSHPNSQQKHQGQDSERFSPANGYAQHSSNGVGDGLKTPISVRKPSHGKPLSPPAENISDDDVDAPIPGKQANGSSLKAGRETIHSSSASDRGTLEQLREENSELKERLKKSEGHILADALQELQTEKDKCKLLEAQLDEAHQKISEMNDELEKLIEIISEERERRDSGELNLRTKLQEASSTIEELRAKIRLLERSKSSNGRV